MAAIACTPDIELHFPVNIFVPQVPPEKWLAALGDDAGAYTVVADACEVTPMALAPGYE